MNRIISRGALAAIGCSAVAAGMAGAAQARTLRGVIIHHNERGHSFVVADRAGHLYAVHAAQAPSLRSEVVVHAKLLSDGTYKLQRMRGAGRAAARVRVRGVVSHVDQSTGDFTVSGAGVSLLVRAAHRHAAHAADATPELGNVVVVTGVLDDQGDLEDQNIQTVGQDTGAVELEGTILSIDAAANTITVSADDEDRSASSITVTVPATLDISQFTPLEEVELLVTPTGSDTATLLGSADDENAQSADDRSESQGDDPGDTGDGEHHGNGNGEHHGNGHGDGRGDDQVDDQGSQDAGGTGALAAPGS